MMNLVDGISSTLHIEANGRRPLTRAIRHFLVGQIVLEEEPCDELQQDEAVTANLHFIMNGRVNRVRMAGRVKIDRLYGTRVVFEPNSMLRDMARRLLKAKREKAARQNEVTAPAARVARRCAPHSGSCFTRSSR